MPCEVMAITLVRISTKKLSVSQPRDNLLQILKVMNTKQDNSQILARASCTFVFDIGAEFIAEKYVNRKTHQIVIHHSGIDTQKLTMVF